MSDAHRTANAIDALRRGWPIAIAGTDGTLALLPIETADPERLAAFDPSGTAPVLISAGRAATLKLANQREAAAPDAPVLIERTPWLDFATATALADPAIRPADAAQGAVPRDPPRRPAMPRPQRCGSRGSAGVLPAFFARPDGAADADRDARRYRRAMKMRRG